MSLARHLTSTLRGSLLLLVGAIAILLVTLSSAIVWGAYRDQRDRAEDRLRGEARAMAALVDREFALTKMALRGLTVSAALARGDLESFEAELRAVSAGLGGAPIALVAANGLSLLDTGWGLGERRPNVPGPAVALQVLFTGRSEISDLERDMGTGEPALRVAVPVFLPFRPGMPDRLTHVLTTAVARELFADILAEQRLAEDWVASVLDRRGMAVARTTRDAETVGQPAQPVVRAALAEADEGIVEVAHRTLEGLRAMTGFARAAETGYVVLVGMPRRDFEAPLRAAMIQTQALGGVVVLLGLGLALLLGRRVSRGLRALEALGREPGLAARRGAAGAAPGSLGTPGAAPGLPRPANDLAGTIPSGLREVDDVARVLIAASRERAEAEQRRDLVVAELNHRVKNTLATVQSVATQTLRGAEGDLTRFTHDFGSRLQSLATAHDLLTAHAWQDTDLRAIIRAALAPWTDAGGRVALSGPAGIPLNPRQAQAMVLGLHELATNAVKHGALSRASGRVELGWARRGDGMAVLDWRETGGPPLPGRPERRGFGTRLLERALAYDLGGRAQVDLRYMREGLQARIIFLPAHAGAEPAPAASRVADPALAGE